MLLNPYRFGGAGPTFKVLELLFEGANGSTTFTDTAKGRTFSAVGSAVISTAQAYSGSSSGLFVPNSSLAGPNNTDYDFGAGEFLIRVAIRPANIAGGVRMILSNRSSAGADFGFLLWQINTQIRFLAWGPTGSTTLVDITGGSLAATTWALVEVKRAVNTWTIDINSVNVASTTVSGTIVASPNMLLVGKDASTSVRDFDGYIDALQVYKGGFT